MKIKIKYYNGDSYNYYIYQYGINYSTNENMSNDEIIKNRLKSKNVIDDVENLLKDYVLEHFDKYDIQRDSSYVYDVMKEKAYDILCEYINNLCDDENKFANYDVNNYAQDFYENIDISCIDESINDILNTSYTIEEKLSDIGMSINDFL